MGYGSKLTMECWVCPRDTLRLYRMNAYRSYERIQVVNQLLNERIELEITEIQCRVMSWKHMSNIYYVTLLG